MKVSDLFFVYPGSKLDYAKQQEDEKGLNFVSRISVNNGIAGKVIVDAKAKKYKAGDITVPLGGSLLFCFVQDEDFVTAQNVAVLRPKSPMQEVEKWFYCYALRENKFKFSAFGREVNKYINDIELPDGIPAWVYSARVNPMQTTIKCSNLPIDATTWRYFTIGEEKGGLFRLERCKNSASADLSDGEDCFYLGARKSANCVMRRVVRDGDLVTKGNCIVFIGNGQGSVGYSNYMNEDFIGTADLTVGYNEHLNPFIGLFIVAVLDLERPKYSFGRKWSARIADTRIKLPATEQGLPDWAYMEGYIKSLPYADRI